MKELTKKLAVIQQQINAPKNLYNRFGKYNYRSCESILTALKPLLDDLVVTLLDEIVQIGDRFYVKSTAEITDGENNICVSAFARESFSKKGMDDSQITGSTSSYARKYALSGLLLIDDGRDEDDEFDIITPQQIGNLERLYNNSSLYGSPEGENILMSFASLSVNRYEGAVKHLEMHQLHESERLPNTSTGNHE